ncbi:MAG: L-iditol 2-dehydrogenase [Kiritimatiellia bacterium]|jgi:L-iditol 2-dehydrogenase
MKALRRLRREAHAAEVQQVNPPTPGPGEVLLRVAYCGICGSDLHAYLNHAGYESVLPAVTFGHEFSGHVVTCGADVDGWKEGQAAIMIAVQGCLQCELCASGLPQLCPNRRVQGLHLDGGMAEYVVVDQQYLIPIPEQMDLKAAALTEPLSVAQHCVADCSSIKAGDRVAVTGPGIIGMLSALVARHIGAEVIVCGTAADEAVRLSAARKIGFKTITVGKDLPPLHEQLSAPVDVLIEASGAPMAFSQAWQSVRPNGEVAVIAIYGFNADMDVTQFVRKQIDIRTTYASSQPNYLAALELLAAGGIPVDELVKVYPLSEGIKGFKDAERQAVMKPMLACGQG